VKTLSQSAITAITAIAIAAAVVPTARATPQEIIILRHGEKKDDHALCDMGAKRADALAAQYLGKGAANSLFAGTDGPAAFFAITLHPLETITPAAATWGLPVIMFSVTPLADKNVVMTQLNRRTQEAARAVLSDPQWSGKIVVMDWEHHHIADAMLPPEVQLRHLLNIDRVASPPSATWSGKNYDYFWIVKFGLPGSNAPTVFTSIKQTFTGQFQDVPANDWGAKERPRPPGCIKIK